MNDPFEITHHQDGHVTFKNVSEKTVMVQKISFGNLHTWLNTASALEPVEVKPGETFQVILRVVEKQ